MQNLLYVLSKGKLYLFNVIHTINLMITIQKMIIREFGYAIVHCIIVCVWHVHIVYKSFHSDLLNPNVTFLSYVPC